jgi:hypothetical protein
MDNVNKKQEEKAFILAGICPANHNTDDRVCKGCYEDLLKKYNSLKNLSSTSTKKSQWQTW